LKTLGPNYLGVTQIPDDTDDKRIAELHEAGVRAVRFNVARGGSAHLVELENLERRVYDLACWHAEFYIYARTIDEGLEQRSCTRAASRTEHLGMHEDGLCNLLRRVEKRIKVKATTFGRGELDPAATIKAIVDVDPTALMVGTDLPTTRAKQPFANADFALIAEALTPEQAAAVFWENAAAFYLGDN